MAAEAELAGPADLGATLAEPLEATLHFAARPGQSLDQLEKSAAIIGGIEDAFKLSPPPQELQWRLGEAAASVFNQLCDKAELPPGNDRDYWLSEFEARAHQLHKTVVQQVIERAQAIERRDVAYFSL